MVEKHLTPDEKLQQEFNRWAAAGHEQPALFYLQVQEGDLARCAETPLVGRRSSGPHAS
jgi:hypothetical protein